MEQGTIRLKTGLAEMLKGGVIMDVTTPEQAKIAEDAGACAVMALERIPADIRSGAVEAGDLVFLYRNLAVPESTGKMDEQKPVSPEPETDEDSKVVAPPIAPDGGRTADGLMPLPGEQPVPASADQERISREREKILRELESVPDRLEEPWSRTFSGKPVER